MNKDYNIRLSDAITWLRFPLIFCIIMLHCYSVVKLPGNHETYFRAVFPFYLWLGETGVPGFFFISGYLFFLSKKNYSQKLKTRFYTLFTPYMMWNLILLLIYLTAFAVGYPQDINGKNMANYDWLDYFRLFWDRGSFDDGNFVPLLCPLWYVRNLLIMSIISPLVYYITKYLREFFLLALLLWWMTTYHNAFVSQTLMFFCTGAYFSIFKLNPLKLAYGYRWLVMILFAGLGLCDYLTHVAWTTPFNFQIHRFSLIANIPAFFLIADYFVARGFSNKWLANSAFIVFCVHYPIVVFLRKYCAHNYGYASDYFHIALYFACVATATAASIAFYYLLSKCFPKVKNVLSGNR